ncbi:MAG: disulfide bond formation protein DsbB [Alphaproteobacteria bacterium]|jgi:disulfide bond formation protein DsbB
MQWIHEFSQQKRAWAILALSAFGLLMTALYFQHRMDLLPCIKCIYQRTAVVGVLLAAIIPLLYNHLFTRLAAFFVWAYSSVQGILVAREHLDVIFATNPFANICDIVPNFPSFLPLHEWLPAIFGATGDCNENSWQFLGMGMANWMQIIFSIYLLILVVVLVANVYSGIVKRKA